KPRLFSSQDAIEVAGRQFQLFDKRIRIFDIPGGKQIRADDDAVRPDFADQKAQRFGIVIEIVVMESPEVVTEWALCLQLRRAHVKETVLDAREDERECASAMWQDNLESRKFVEGPGGDELQRRGGVFKREAKPVGDAGRADQTLAVEVRLAIERMEQERITELLASREDRLEGRLEQVVALLDGVRQVNGPHAGLAGDAVQFLQCHRGVSDGHRDAGHEAVCIGGGRVNNRLVEALREADALFRRRPLPWHSAGERQAVHLEYMLA